MGGGGGDDYSAQQAIAESKKQTARNALNAVFGVGSPGGSAGAAPTPAGGAAGGPTAEYEPGQTMLGNVVRQLAPSGPVTPAATGDEIAGNKAGRDTMYQTVRDNAFNSGKRRFDENKDRASRDLRFSLFAQGLNGGSADVDENALLDRTYKQGLLDVGSKADAARTDMMGSDENTRLGLLQSIDSGMDQGSALSSALNQMKINSDRAATSAQGTDVGDLFANAGLLYSKSNAARGRGDANNWWANYGYPSSGGVRAPRGGASGSVTSTGN